MKKKKSLFKKWWFWVIAIILFIRVMALLDSDTENDTQVVAPVTTVATTITNKSTETTRATVTTTTTEPKSSTPTTKATTNTTTAPATTKATISPIVNVISNVAIVELDKKYEYIALKNNTKADINLKGWKIVSVKGSQSYIFENNYILQPGQIVKVVSGSGTGEIKWTGSHIWNNDSSDPAELYNPEGKLVNRWDD